MKAFLLGGGFGTRLRPLTDRAPKCMTDIHGVPLLDIWLDLCARHAIDDVLLNVTGHGEAVRQFLADRSGSGAAVRVTLVEEGEPIGSAGTIRANRRFVERDPAFFVLYADNLTNADLGRLRAFHDARGGILTMGLFRAPRPDQAGIVELDPGARVVAYVEKPREPRSNLANAGIYIARPALLDAIPARPGVVDLGHDVLPQLVGQMHGYEISEYLADIGTPEGLTAARREWVQVDARGPVT